MHVRLGAFNCFICKVKVLILHQHFNTPDSGGPLRSYYLATALLDAGFEVAVITGGKGKKYQVTNCDGIEIHHLPVAYENRFGFYKRGISFVQYALGAVRVARTIENIGICYAISVPITVGQSAIWIRRFLKIPFIFEVGDLWPDAPVQLGFVRNPVLKESLYWLEKRIYSNARTVVALSEPIAAAIAGKSPATHVKVIPNMADTEFFTPTIRDTKLEDKYGVKEHFVVSYVGAIGFANGLDYFIECARASQQANLPVKFLMCGEGAMRQQFKTVVQTLGLKNLTILPPAIRTEVKEILNVTDAAFICYRPFPILETGSPHKYFDGLAAGKLIIVNFKGWMKSEIEEAQCGIALDPRHPHTFTEAIKPFLGDANLLREYQSHARALAERKYSRRELSQKYVRLFQAESSTSGGSSL